MQVGWGGLSEYFRCTTSRKRAVLLEQLDFHAPLNASARVLCCIMIGPGRCARRTPQMGERLESLDACMHAHTRTRRTHVSATALEHGERAPVRHTHSSEVSCTRSCVGGIV